MQAVVRFGRVCASRQPQRFACAASNQPSIRSWRVEYVPVFQKRHFSNSSGQFAAQPPIPPNTSKAPADAKTATKTPQTLAAEAASKAKLEKAAVQAADPLLGAQNVSNAAQRKADWAILKDMVHYIWPKVEGRTFRLAARL